MSTSGVIETLFPASNFNVFLFPSGVTLIFSSSTTAFQPPFTLLSNLPIAVVTESSLLIVLFSLFTLLYFKSPILIVSMLCNLVALATSLSVTVFPSVSDIVYVFSYPDGVGVISLLTNVVFLNSISGCAESSIFQFPPSE